MNQDQEFDDIFRDVPLMAIFRGMGPERTLATARRAWDLGITCVEVPVQTPQDVEALRVVAAEAQQRGLTVGAGTVLTVEQVRVALDAGAGFTVSPGLDLDVVSASHEAGMPSLPGVATATEIQRAVDSGLVWLKAFPASVLTPAWFKAMAGPFPAVKFVATGGMDSRNAGPYYQAGVRVVAVGSALEDDAQLPLLAQFINT